MHARAIDPVNWFRHESGMQSKIQGNFSHYKAESNYIIRRIEGVAIFETNLMLTGGYFMMCRLNFKTNTFKYLNNSAAGFFASIYRSKVKIAAFIVSTRGNFALFSALEKEEFRFRPSVHDISHLPGIVANAPQDRTGTPGEFTAVWIFNITD